jgi:hypothetical protein
MALPCPDILAKGTRSRDPLLCSHPTGLRCRGAKAQQVSAGRHRRRAFALEDARAPAECAGSPSTAGHRIRPRSVTCWWPLPTGRFTPLPTVRQSLPRRFAPRNDERRPQSPPWGRFCKQCGADAVPWTVSAAWNLTSTGDGQRGRDWQRFWFWSQPHWRHTQ